MAGKQTDYWMVSNVRLKKKMDGWMDGVEIHGKVQVSMEQVFRFRLTRMYRYNVKIRFLFATAF